VSSVVGGHFKPEARMSRRTRTPSRQNYFDVENHDFLSRAIEFASSDPRELGGFDLAHQADQACFLD
jgi:hypothetical protein